MQLACSGCRVWRGKLRGSCDRSGRGWCAGEPLQRAAEVANLRGAGGRPAARVSVAKGARRLWGDDLPGTALAAAGSLHFLAVALADGALQVGPCRRWQAAAGQSLPVRCGHAGG